MADPGSVPAPDAVEMEPWRQQNEIMLGSDYGEYLAVYRLTGPLSTGPCGVFRPWPAGLTRQE